MTKIEKWQLYIPNLPKIAYFYKEFVNDISPHKYQVLPIRPIHILFQIVSFKQESDTFQFLPKSNQPLHLLLQSKIPSTLTIDGHMNNLVSLSLLVHNRTHLVRFILLPNITIFFLNFLGCPKELSIVLKNDPQNCHDKAGNYSIATSDQINGRSYWVSSNDKQAIWYENKSWRVGDIEDLGTGICGIYSTSNGNF